MSESCCLRPKKEVEETNEGKKTILFVPLDCVGHVNSLISIADFLKDRGHRTVFLFLDAMDGGLKKKGHEVYDCTQEGLVQSNPTPESEQKWDMIVGAMSKLWRSSILDNIEQTTNVGLGSMMKDIINKDDIVSRKLELIKPDLIVIDHYFIQPAILKYGKPWARVYSASPLALHSKSHNLPPATSGFPSKYLEIEDKDQRESYIELTEKIGHIMKNLYDQWNSYLKEKHGFEPTPLDPLSFIPLSPYLNVYMYPEELDYSHVDAPERWIRCDSILRINAKLPPSEPEIVEKFHIPKELQDKPGKLIFLSMGSLASGDVELMKRLVSILSKSPHRFIVSRGLNWDKYELAPNMWGEKFVAQLSVLPEIDLIITHGGNNTITECFYFGVPGFVVCPVFSDQYDNAQRVEECKLGRRVNPFNCEDDELLEAIEEVLADESIKPRMKSISDRMQSPDNKYKAITLFKDFVEG